VQQQTQQQPGNLLGGHQGLLGSIVCVLGTASYTTDIGNKMAAFLGDLLRLFNSAIGHWSPVTRQIAIALLGMTEGTKNSPRRLMAGIILRKVERSNSLPLPWEWRP
jgi:hypothetical protein